MRSGPCFGRQMPTTDPSGSLGQRISTCLPIVVALILLPGIAFASPPDPSWIAGMYNGGDGDDVVTLVYETTAASATARSDVAPPVCLAEMWLESVVPCLLGDRFTRGSRAPPAIYHGVCSCLQVPATLHSSCSSHGSLIQSYASQQNRDGVKMAERLGSLATPIMHSGSRSVPALRGTSRRSGLRSATHGMRRARQRILVVDDDVTLQEVLTTFLGERYEIRAAMTGAEALRRVCQEPIDLVVLDHRLPDRTGLEVLTEFRSLCPGLPVIMLTGYGSEWICAAAFRLGVADYLRKPVDAADLVEAVHRILPPDPEPNESARETSTLRGVRVPLCTPIQRAMGLIQERYWDKISLTSLARLVGMSKYHLSHRFRELSGITFRDYLLKVRVERAKTLLAADEGSISEVAQMVGFSDHQRLDKVFKRHTGFSPSAYRSMSRGEAVETGRQGYGRATTAPTVRVGPVATRGTNSARKD